MKLGTGALGSNECKRTSELLSGSLQAVDWVKGKTFREKPHILGIFREYVVDKPLVIYIYIMDNYFTEKAWFPFKRTLNQTKPERDNTNGIEKGD